MEFKENKGWQQWGEQQSGEDAGQMHRLWNASENYKNDYQPDVEKGLASFQNRIGQASSAKIVKLSPMKMVMRIAAGVAILAISIFVFKDGLFGKDDPVSLATTTQTEVLSLPDGSEVTLNQSSQLSYLPSFGAKVRLVELAGEAFFQVKRDEQVPFVIKTQEGEVKVLGTSFNVRSYPNEDVFEIYVETGKVQVSIGKNNKTELSAGEFFRLEKSSNKAIRGIDNTGLANVWRTGVMSFRGKSIPVILNGMERLYKVKFDLKTTQIKGCEQTLTVTKGKLEEALAALKTSCPTLKFKETATGQYRVTGSCCE